MLFKKTTSSNINTPKFWDDKFQEEWDILQTAEHAHSVSGYRWDAMRFGVLSSYMPLRGKLLDIGCGIGHFCRYIKARNPYLEVHGVDFTHKGIEFAKQFDPRIDFQNGEATKIPFPDNYFDIVSAQEIIEHLDDPTKAIKEWRRVLKPGGELYITTPWRGAGEQYGITAEVMSVEHLREWTPSEFAKLCSQVLDKDEKKAIFPPAMTDVVSKETTMPVWFLFICKKVGDIK